MSFVHLHNHTEYSILDGQSRLEEIVKRSAELGQPALAITDHGTMGGHRKFYDLCNRYGVKPILGVEAYVAPEARTTKSAVYWGDESQRPDDISGQGSYTHLTLLARTQKGLRNLYELQREGYAEGFYRKPRLDSELLQRHSEGLTCLSGCPGGAVATRLRLSQYEEAEKCATTLASIFPDNFFIELMYHGQQFESNLSKSLAEMAGRLGLPVVATNDCHYTAREDRDIHEAICCLSTYRTLADGSFYSQLGEGYYLRDAAEMVYLSEMQEWPQAAIDNTLVIADSVEGYGSAFSSAVKMPVVVDDEWTASHDILQSDATNGMLKRLGDPSDEYWGRLQYELKTIIELDYSDYFLVVADIVRWCKENAIRVGPGRGSAGGSLVAFALGITDIDPIPFGLLFERFLNLERKSLPDIDIDVDDNRREEVLEYIRKKYGNECVAQLGTYGTIGARAALHDATRLLGLKRSIGTQLTGFLPRAQFGRQPTLAEGAWHQVNYTDDSGRILDLARDLEGSIRNEGVHAAGVIIAPDPITNYAPVRAIGENRDQFVTNWDMTDIESVGLVKMDFLGLRNLGVIDESLLLLNAGLKLPTTPAELTDRKTYELLASGNTLGVFQLDSPGMRGLLRKLKPQNFHDIQAVLALYRPGPMGVDAHNTYCKRRYTSIHPDLDPKIRHILEETYGLVVFQEQVLEVLRVVCGWSYSEADLVFNAMRKKDRQKMAAAKPRFMAAAQSNGYSEQCCEVLWETLVPFADYSFNKAHTTGYGLVAYWTAYLKANYPVEFMAALLSSINDPDKLKEYLDECEKMGIDLLLPDINTSDSSFTPVGEAIRYGLSAIKGVGDKATVAIIKNRPYKDLNDFFLRADRKALNSKVLGALIKSGAMDSLWSDRARLNEEYEQITAHAMSVRTEIRKGQTFLIKPKFEPVGSNLDSCFYKFWEAELLGTVFTSEPIELKLTRPLTEMEWEFVRTLTTAHPGRQKVYATLPSGLRFLTGFMSVNNIKLVKSLWILGIEVS